jgi:hypothetical protein
MLIPWFGEIVCRTADQPEQKGGNFIAFET